MTVPPWEPEPELSTERVRGGAWKGAVVFAVAVLVVGALVWKPWDSAANPGASPTNVAVALASPSSIPLVALIVTPQPSSSPSIRPTSVPLQLGTVQLGSDGKFVQCGYDKHLPPRLRIVTVDGPVITPADDAAAEGLGYVTWSAALESQRLSKVFEDDWQPENTSALHMSTIDGTKAVTFKSDSFKPDTSTMAADTILRVRITVDWMTRNGIRLEEDTIIQPDAYTLAVKPYTVETGGCPLTPTD